MLFNTDNLLMSQAEQRLTLAKGLLAETASLVRLGTDVEFYQRIMTLIGDVAEVRLEIARRSWGQL
jgi:hypothetical protein